MTQQMMKKTVNLAQILEQWSIEYSTHTALIHNTHRVSYAELKQRIDQLAGALYSLGLGQVASSGKEEHAIIQLPNGIDFVVTFFALCQIGVIPVLTMPTQCELDIKELAKIAQPSAYFIGANSPTTDFYTRAKTLQLETPSLQYIITGDNNALPSSDYHKLSSLYGEKTYRTPCHQRIALLLISGGTTGTPKLIPRTHQDYYFNFTESAKVCGLSDKSVYLAVLPAAHNFTLACPGILGILSVGGTVIFADFPDPSETLPLIEQYRVTHTALIPTLAHLWEQARDWEKSDLSSLKCVQVGGAKLNNILAGKLFTRIGPVQQVFGMAEGLLCYTRLDDPITIVRDTQGKPLSEQDQVRVVDADLNCVPFGHEGELLTRGPYTISGYYRAEQHNKTAFTGDGFYRTGDLVKQMDNGYLKVVGRIKEQINRNGEKVSVVEIESRLQDLSLVSDVTLLGIPDTILGERSCAVIIPAKNYQLDAEILRQQLVDKGLSHYKIPDQFEFIKHWPLTAVGKIDKKLLIKKYTNPQ